MLMEVSLKHCWSEQSHSIWQLVMDSENKKDSSPSFSNCHPWFPLHCLPVLSKSMSAVCCHQLPATHRFFFMWTVFYLQFLLQKWLYQNLSRYTLQSPGISVVFPLFLWDIFLSLCKHWVSSRYHSWNGNCFSLRNEALGFLGITYLD